MFVNYSLVLDAALSLEVKEFGDLTEEQCVSFFTCGTACYLYTRFLHENCKQLKVYHVLRKGLPQISKDFLEFQKEPEELEGFAKLVSYIKFHCFQAHIPLIVARFGCDSCPRG